MVNGGYVAAVTQVARASRSGRTRVMKHEWRGMLDELRCLQGHRCWVVKTRVGERSPGGRDMSSKSYISPRGGAGARSRSHPRVGKGSHDNLQ